MKIKKFIIQSILGFVLWTILLTPYMLWVVRTNLAQYLKWGLMQLIIVPPCSIIVVNLTNYIVGKFNTDEIK